MVVSTAAALFGAVAGTESAGNSPLVDLALSALESFGTDIDWEKVESVIKMKQPNKNANFKLCTVLFSFTEKFTILRKVISLPDKNRTVVKNIAVVSLISLLLVICSFHTAGLREYKVKRIIIDAGHGGKDPGTSGKISKEKDIALKVALELGAIMEEYLPEVEVVYTRKDNTFIELNERANIANKNHADLFISIHCNAVENPNTYGTETWVMGLKTSEGNLEVSKRENSVVLYEENYQEKYEGFDPNSPESHILFSLSQNAYLSNSLTLAEKVEHQFKKRVQRNSRGVKQAGFIVLWKTAMPSVLIEIGFLSNEKEERYLNDEYGRTLIASGIFRAIRDYKEEIESTN